MSDLRQTARRDDDLPPIARLLFAEIWQMNEGAGECYAEDDWLGKQIGAAESTVRKHRLTLRQKGYIKQSRSGGRRYLEPNDVINIDQSDQQQSENTSTADQSDQNRSDEVINTDQHRGSNNPEGTRESAPAHEDSSEESPDQLFSALVDVWRSVGTAPPLNRNTEDVLWEWAQDGTVQDIGLFREVLQEQSADTTAKGCGLSTGILLKEYRKQRDAGKLEPWQKEDGRYSVDEEGRVCFKGVPLSETGPQNVYDDYEGDTRKDGSMRREPEVSPS